MGKPLTKAEQRKAMKKVLAQMTIEQLHDIRPFQKNRVVPVIATKTEMIETILDFGGY